MYPAQVEQDNQKFKVNQGYNKMLPQNEIDSVSISFLKVLSICLF